MSEICREIHKETGYICTLAGGHYGHHEAWGATELRFEWRPETISEVDFFAGATDHLTTADIRRCAKELSKNQLSGEDLIKQLADAWPQEYKIEFSTEEDAKKAMECVNIATAGVIDECAQRLDAAKKLTEEHNRELLAALFDSWIPSAENINSLPSSIRKYVHDLETRCDPSGDTQTIAILTENVKALENLREECAQRVEEIADHITNILDRGKLLNNRSFTNTYKIVSGIIKQELAAAIRSHKET